MSVGIHDIELYNSTGITGDDTGEFIALPANICTYYFLYQATENSAGSITLTVNENEIQSVSGAGNVWSPSAITSTSNGRILTLEAPLAPYLYVAVSSVSGDWDLSVSIYYSKKGR